MPMKTRQASSSQRNTVAGRRRHGDGDHGRRQYSRHVVRVAEAAEVGDQHEQTIRAPVESSDHHSDLKERDAGERHRVPFRSLPTDSRR